MDVLMPQLGETVNEGKISIWFKQAGDMVEAGENLFEIETDKVSMEVQAITSGRLDGILVPAGGVAPVGAVVAVIGNGQGAPASPAPDHASAQAQAQPPAPVAPARASAAPAEAVRQNGSAAAAASSQIRVPSLGERGFAPFNEVFTPAQNFGPARVDDMRITPLARRLIAQNGLDLQALVRRARAEGRSKIAARDAQDALKSGRAEAPPLSPPPMPAPAVARDRSEAVPLNRIRRQTARHLQSSWREIPHVVQAVEIDFSAVSAARDAHKESFLKKHRTALTFLPFIARAACLALAAFPRVNASLDGDVLHVRQDINLGFAVDLSHEGLVVPVVRNADRLTVAGLALGISELVQKAREGKLTPVDVEGGTYSITNNGSFGTLFTAPLINAPQVAILSTDSIRKRPVVVETEFGDAIVARPVGVVAQSFDHRAFDGAYSAAFLQKLKEVIERRDWTSELA